MAETLTPALKVDYRILRNRNFLITTAAEPAQNPRALMKYLAIKCEGSGNIKSLMLQDDEQIVFVVDSSVIRDVQRKSRNAA